MIDLPMRVVFLIRSLNLGGAESQLLELVSGLNPGRVESVVVTFYDGGDLHEKFSAVPGVRTLSLGKRGRWDFRFVWNLLRIVREERPAVLHSYMGGANAVAAFISLLSRRTACVWGVRCSTNDPTISPFERTIGRVEALFSRFADAIIVNSDTGAHSLENSGYQMAKVIVVHNGVDTARFKPDGDARKAFRDKHDIGGDDFLIGIVGRVHPVKGHDLFFSAAAQLVRTRTNARFVCIGNSETDFGDVIRERVASDQHLAARVTWLPMTMAPERVYPALDLLASTSASEGFSNVIAEAMACGVPCTVTPVGDSSQIVGPTGFVIKRDANAFNSIWEFMADMSPRERAALGQDARQRVITNFSKDRLVEVTEGILRKVVH